MLTVYKYNAPLNDYINFDLPLKAKLLKVDSQNDGEDGDETISLWALVNLEEKRVHTRKIRIAGTGHPIDEKILEYINTFTMMERKLWFHAFEVL
jgi:hypothetical protein